MASTYSYPSDFNLQTVIPIKDQSSLEGNLRSDVIYHIDAGLKLNQSIQVPDGGLFIEGSDANLSGLDCAGAFPLFTGGGNLFVRNCKLGASATGSSVFDLTATDSNNGCEMTTVNFEQCKSLGMISGYRQGLWLNVALFNCDDGLTLAGTWGGGFRVDTVICRLFDTGNAGGILLRGATGATFGTRIVSNANIEVNGNSTAYHFTPAMFASDKEFQLLGGELSGTGTYVTGIDVTSTKALWDSRGIPLSAPGGKLSLTTQASTAITATDTPVKVAGTTTLSDAIWVDTDSTDNRLRWLSEFEGDVRILGVLSFTSGNNNQLGVVLKVYNDADVEQESITFPPVTTNGTGRAESITIAQYLTLQQNWYIEIWVENQSATQDITLESNSILLIEQRKGI